MVVFNLEFFLVAATVFTGLVVLAPGLWRGENKPFRRRAWLVELSRSFFPVLLIVLLFRSFLFEPFRIPSGSMLPTLQIGDFILVNKFSYGLRLPVFHTPLVNIGEPERGDVVVFRFPNDPSQNFIKRLVGLPGDHVVYHDKKLNINGDLVDRDILEEAPYSRRGGLNLVRERLDGADYAIALHGANTALGGSWRVPADSYFVMGDNRDNSNDSRVWGFVPKGNLVGRASLVWMHWSWGGGIDLSRIGTRI